MRMYTNNGCETAKTECSGINPSQVSSPKKVAIALLTSGTTAKARGSIKD